jgi:hypothetical protein
MIEKLAEPNLDIPLIRQNCCPILTKSGIFRCPRGVEGQVWRRGEVHTGYSGESCGKEKTWKT